MVITSSIVGVILMLFIFRRINATRVFNKEVKALFANATDTSTKRFYKRQLDKLPEPVQRYFNHILKDGQSYINYARIKHIGQFKTLINKDWVNIKGEQYATTQIPGFIWKGTTATFVARDMYMAKEGRLVVSLFSLFNVVNAKGEQYNQGELLRWLGESILYPTNFLPSDRLHWLPIDSKTAQLVFKYDGLSLFFKITFNEIGEITEMETKRYMNEKDRETWVIKATNYRELNDICIPTNFEVIWRLKTGDFSYAKFIITEVEYGTPEKF